MKRLAALAALLLAARPLFAQIPKAKPEQTPRRSQAEVAAKITFGQVAANSPNVKKALVAKDLAGAKKWIGKDGSFTGTVIKVFAPKSNSIVILNFDADYKAALTAALKSEHFPRFPVMGVLQGKKVLVSGKFVDYNGASEILLTQPSQIKIIK